MPTWSGGPDRKIPSSVAGRSGSAELPKWCTFGGDHSMRLPLGTPAGGGTWYGDRGGLAGRLFGLYSVVRASEASCVPLSRLTPWPIRADSRAEKDDSGVSGRNGDRGVLVWAEMAGNMGTRVVIRYSEPISVSMPNSVSTQHGFWPVANAFRQMSLLPVLSWLVDSELSDYDTKNAKEFDDPNDAPGSSGVAGGARIGRCRFRFPTPREYCFLNSLTPWGLWRVMKSLPPTNLLLFVSERQL